MKQSRWVALWQRLGGPGTGGAYFAELVRAYEQPWRAYHTTAHLAHCLAEFDQVRALLVAPDLVEFALWVHDAVYDPRAADNEAQSAAWAAAVLTAAGLDKASIERVTALILATRHNTEPADVDSCYLVDRDYTGQGNRCALGTRTPCPSPPERTGRPYSDSLSSIPMLSISN